MKKKSAVFKKMLASCLAAALTLGGPGSGMVLAEEIQVDSVIVEEADSQVEFGESVEDADSSILSDDPVVIESSEGETGAADQNLPKNDEILSDYAGEETDVLLETENVAGNEASVPTEGLILSVETAEDPLYVANEISVSDAEPVAAEEVEMIQLEETGLASCAALPRMGVFSLNTYTDSYGAQLEGTALTVYQQLAAVWGTGQTDNVVVAFSEPLTFLTDGTIQKNAATGNNEVIWDKENCDEYQELLAELRYAVQSALDAFTYDYPETFWLRSSTYGYSISFAKKSDTQLRGSISKIAVCGKGTYTDSSGNVCLRERYEGATEEVVSFQAAVDAAVANITASLPENADAWDTVKAIHDYICNTVSYGENEYAHTAAGVFHKENKVVVCEGYAKAMKILCRRFGITCALIVGNARKSTGTWEAHMWNYVKMDDGNWYMVDATWDDQASRIYDTYFLVGSRNQGFNAVIGSERQNFTQFSTADYTMSFTLPVLSENHYCRWQVTEETKADCTTEGKISYQCGRANCINQKTVNIDPLGHAWDAGTVLHEATCTDGEEVVYRCTREGCNGEKTETGDQLGHSYDTKWTVDKSAACTEDGEKSHHCIRTGCTARTDVTVIPSAHIGETEVRNARAATCTADGYTGDTYCKACGELLQQGKTIAKTGHAWNTGKVTKTAGCTITGIRTYTCTRTGCGKTKIEKIAALGHKYGSWKTKTKATVLKSGLKISTCSRCGDIRTKSISKLTPVIKLNVSKLPLKLEQSTTAVKVTKMASGDYVKSWKSSNSRIASVSKTGKITGKKAGTATITVTLASKAEASVKVTVQKTTVKTTGLTVQGKTTVISNHKLTLKKGKKESLIVSRSPLTSGEKVTYVSSNKKVALVSEKGVITALKAGKTTITVKSGSKKEILTLTVK